MDRARILMVASVAMVLGGLAALIAAYAQGDADLSVVLIFPVLSGSGGVFAAGVLLFMGGFFLLFLSWSMRTMSRMALEDDGAPSPAAAPPASGGGPGGPVPASGGPQWGGVVFIGPIPIAFGSNPRMNRIMLVAAIVMAVLFFVFLLGLFV
jgi:uncharacterized membrane protein